MTADPAAFREAFARAASLHPLRRDLPERPDWRQSAPQETRPAPRLTLAPRWLHLPRRTS